MARAPTSSFSAARATRWSGRTSMPSRTADDSGGRHAAGAAERRLSPALQHRGDARPLSRLQATRARRMQFAGRAAVLHQPAPRRRPARTMRTRTPRCGICLAEALGLHGMTPQMETVRIARSFETLGTPKAASRLSGLGRRSKVHHMRITALDHVQLAMPAGREAAARAFYARVSLGIPKSKPLNSAKRGGCSVRARPLEGSSRRRGGVSRPGPKSPSGLSGREIGAEAFGRADQGRLSDQGRRTRRKATPGQPDDPLGNKGSSRAAARRRTAPKSSRAGRAKSILGADLCALNTLPQTGRSQLQKVPVRIAEIDAVAATRPLGPPFDLDTGFAQALFPGRELSGRDREGDADRTVAVDGAGSCRRCIFHGLAGLAAAKQPADPRASPTLIGTSRRWSA